MNQKYNMCLKEIRQFARNLLIIISCQHESVYTYTVTFLHFNTQTSWLVPH